MKIKSAIVAFVLNIFIPVLLNADRSEDVNAVPTFMTVPKVDRPFKITPISRIVEAGTVEWLASNAASGFTHIGSSSLTDSQFLGRPYDGAIWLAYSDTTLYIAFLTWIQGADEGLSYRSKTNSDQSPSILDDDYFTFALSLQNRSEAHTNPSYFFTVSSSGQVYFRINEFLPGQQRLIDPERVERAVLVTDKEPMGGKWWSIKLAVPLDLLEVDSLDGRKGLMLAMLGSGFFKGSLGAATSWDDAAELSFDPKLPLIFRVNGSYPGYLPNAQNVHLDLDVRAREKGRYAFDMRLLEGEEILWQKSVGEFLKSGQLGKQTLRARLPEVQNAGRFATCLMWYPETGSSERLFQQESIIRPVTPQLKQLHEDWEQERRRWLPAEFAMDYVASPYTNQIEVFVDKAIYVSRVDPDQRPKATAILEADEARMELVASNGNAFLQETTAFNGTKARAILAKPERIPDDTYQVRVTLLRSGDEVAVQAMPWHRQSFPWENNTIGKEPVVIPPWTPIVMKGETLEVLNRVYAIGDNGLPAAIESLGRPMLSGPIELSGQTANGESFTLKANDLVEIELVPGKTFPADFKEHRFKATSPEVELLETDGYQAKVVGSSGGGGIRAKVNGILEFEGWYGVELTLEPLAGPVKLDSIEMVVPLSDEFDTMRFTRQYNIAGQGAIPEGEGLLYDSRQLPPVKNVPNGFTPIVYIGDYDTGFWWFAESDQGWLVNDAESLFLLERVQGQLRLRVRFVNAPATLDEARKIQFALMASPATDSPLQKRRFEWILPGDEPPVAHDTSGYRYYGAGVDGFELYTEEDYLGLYDYLYTREYDSNLIPRQTPQGKTWNYSARVPELARKGLPVVLYGSTFMAAASMKSFDTYGSGWIQTADFDGRLRVDETFRGRDNYGSTEVWDTTRELQPFYGTMDPAFVDAHLWHMSRMGEFSKINGTFYDNFQHYATDVVPYQSAVTGVAYRRDDGTLVALANSLRKHFWNKRYSTAQWLMGRPPWQVGSNEQDNTFAFNWYVEGAMYVRNQGQDWFDQGMTPEVFRAFTSRTNPLASVTSSIPDYMDASGKPYDVDEAAARIVMATCLLHDIGASVARIDPYWMGRQGDERVNRAAKIIKALDETVGFYTDAELLRYWKDETGLEGIPDGLYVGGYRSADGNKTVLILLNGNETQFSTRLGWAEKPGLGGNAAAVNNLENGKAIVFDEEGFEMDMKPRSVQFILVESTD